MSTAAAEVAHPALDETLDALREAAPRLLQVPPARLAELLKQMNTRILDVDEAWVADSARGKRMPAGSPLIGEEWASGPWALAAALNALVHSLDALGRGRSPIDGFKVHTRPDGRVVVDVFPGNGWDALLLSGFTAQVWQQPGVTEANLRDHVAVRFRSPPEPKVSLILGAGNINSIPPLDALWKVIGEGQVCLVKLNPLNAYLEPHLTHIFEPLSDFVRFVNGDGAVGAYLCNHEQVDTMHITGAETTHDLIVFGPGEDGARRRAANDPANPRTMTSELGGVGPTLVVPGPWSAADFQFQAEHLVTQKLHNAGHNCIASQLLVVPESWDGTDTLVAKVEEVLKGLAPRPSWYPKTDVKVSHFLEAHPKARRVGATPGLLLIDGLEPDKADMCFSYEAFGPVWGVVRLPGADAVSFLEHAVAFANDALRGTLGCQILIHPTTEKASARALDKAVADLRYGTIAVNAWSGVGFLLPNATWGAFPGHPLNDVQSGIGVVHNALLFDKSEKTVVRGPFQPFPRTVLRGQLHSSPKPPWFVTNKKAHQTLKLLTRFEVTRNPLLLPGIFANALTG